MRLFPALLFVSSLAAPLMLGCSADSTEDATNGDLAIQQQSQGWSLGRHEGVRDSAPSKAYLDTQKMTYTGRGKLTLHAVFEPKSENEGANVGHADLFQMNFDLSLDEHSKLFESSEAVTITDRQGDVYLEGAQASGAQGNRKVVIRWESNIDNSPRKGELSIALGAEGRITRFQMKKWAKGRIVFDETVSQPSRTESGLLLLDDRRVGRVQDTAKVKEAIDDPSPRNFERLAGSQ
jgi:hypothetical protein